MKQLSIHWLELAVMVVVFVLVGGGASVQAACSVDYIDQSELSVNCDASDDNVEVFVEVIVTDDTLEPERTLYVDIGDGAGPVEQGDAAELKLISVATKDGHDRVNIHDLEIELGIAVTTGGGGDTVIIGPNVAVDELFEINTGNGKDTIAMGLNVSVNTGILNVQAGGSNDAVTTFAATEMGYYGISAVNDIILDGGAGEKDIVTILPGSIFSGNHLRIRRFETIGGM